MALPSAAFGKQEHMNHYHEILLFCRPARPPRGRRTPPSPGSACPSSGGFWPHLSFLRAFTESCRHFCIPRGIPDLQNCQKISAQLRINLFWPKNRAPPGKTLAKTPACNYRPTNALQTFPGREFCPRVGQNPVLAWQNPVCAQTPQESENCLTTRILRFWPKK